MDGPLRKGWSLELESQESKILWKTWLDRLCIGYFEPLPLPLHTRYLASPTRISYLINLKSGNEKKGGAGGKYDDLLCSDKKTHRNGIWINNNWKWVTKTIKNIMASMAWSRIFCFVFFFLSSMYVCSFVCSNSIGGPFKDDVWYWHVEKLAPRSKEYTNKVLKPFFHIHTRPLKWNKCKMTSNTYEEIIYESQILISNGTHNIWIIKIMHLFMNTYLIL